MNRFPQALAGAALSALLLAAGAHAQPAPAPITDDQVRASFSAADANRDGAVDIDEAVADAILVFGRYDANGDGFLAVSELPRHSPDRFRRADRDGDGKLSIGEVAGDRVYEFFLIDANRNGVITFEEVLAYTNIQRNARK